MGSCSAQMIDKFVVNKFYKDRKESVTALSEAMNVEHHRLADAGCQVIQVEEPCVHYASDIEWEGSTTDYVAALNREVRGLRAKTEVWCHTCWGNPLAQRIESSYSYKSVLPHLDRLDVDVITFETAENEGAELAEVAAAIGKTKKICIGMVNHRTLKRELPAHVAALVRKALEHIGPERLVLSSDLRLGRPGQGKDPPALQIVRN